MDGTVKSGRHWHLPARERLVERTSGWSARSGRRVVCRERTGGMSRRVFESEFAWARVGSRGVGILIVLSGCLPVSPALRR